jgi:hypothetical protein
MAAALAYLEDGTTGINATLASVRSEFTITTAQLPDVAVFEGYYHRASQAEEFPYLSIVWLSRSGEQDGANGRMYDHDFIITIVVIESAIEQEPGSNQQQATAKAAVRYSDALARTFRRRLPRGSQGWTLGGSGGITRAEVGVSQFGTDPELEYSNLAITTALAVRTNEDF